MNVFTRITAISAIAAATCIVPTTVNATHGQANGHQVDIIASGDAMKAREAYMARRSAEAERSNVQTQQTRKALIAMMLAFQASCEGACVDA